MVLSQSHSLLFKASLSLVRDLPILVVWRGGGDSWGEQRELKAPQEQSDEEIEAVPPESVRCNGKQLLIIRIDGPL